MVTPSSEPSAPPQTVRKPDGPPPDDFGEISQHSSFGVVKWREEEGSHPPMNEISNQTPDEHIYDEIPTTGEYMGIWELESRSENAAGTIDIGSAVSGYRQAPNSQHFQLQKSKDQLEHDLRKLGPLDLSRFPGLPAPKEGQTYVMGANGVPILVRQDAFDATTPIHCKNRDFPQCENANCPYASKGKYPYIDSSQKTLETFRSEGETIDESGKMAVSDALPVSLLLSKKSVGLTLTLLTFLMMSIFSLIIYIASLTKLQVGFI